MSTFSTQEKFSDEIFDQEEKWEFFEEGILKKTRTTLVCMTCQHFIYRQDLNYIIFLACYIQHRLIPHGDHLTSHRNLWIQLREKEIGCYQEAA